MKIARGLVLLVALSTGGCLPDRPPAPEELALDHYKDGEEYLSQGRVAEAAVEYEYATKNRPRWKEAYVKLAYCRELQGKDDEAVAVLERLLHVDSSDEEGLRAVAKIYARRGESEKALDRYRRLRKVAPDDPTLAGEIARLEALRKP